MAIGVLAAGTAATTLILANLNAYFAGKPLASPVS